MTPQGLKDIFCQCLKLFAGAPPPPTKSIGRIATKDTLPLLLRRRDETQKESLCSYGAAATYTNPAAFLDRRAMKSGERVEVRIEGLAKGIECQVWISGARRAERGKVSAA